jgi:hypothetical protein
MGFFLFHLGAATEHAQYAAQQQQLEKRLNGVQPKDNRLYSFWEWTTHDPVAFYTFILALFTLVLAVSTIGLWIVTYLTLRHARDDAERQAKEMQETFRIGSGANQIAATNAERQLRAYVTAPRVILTTHRLPSTLSATNHLKAGPIDTFDMVVVFRNGGQTPARNVIIKVSSAEIPIPFRGGFNFQDTGRVGYGLIGPNSEVSSPLLSNKAVTFERGTDGHKWLLWGSVEYDDIFAGSYRHRTEFCFEMVVRTLPVSGELTIDFEPFPEYNNMDGDCMRSFDPHTNKYAKDGL